MMLKEWDDVRGLVSEILEDYDLDPIEEAELWTRICERMAHCMLIMQGEIAELAARTPGPLDDHQTQIAAHVELLKAADRAIQEPVTDDLYWDRRSYKRD